MAKAKTIRYWIWVDMEDCFSVADTVERPVLSPPPERTDPDVAWVLEEYFNIHAIYPVGRLPQGTVMTDRGVAVHV